MHCDDAEILLRALKPGATEDALVAAREKVTELESRDDLFPDILDSLEAVLHRE